MSRRLIVNLRGANGSGKSTIARHFLEHHVTDYLPIDYRSAHNNREKRWPVTRVELSSLKLPVLVQGRYPHGKPTGGCDCEHDMDAIQHCIETSAAQHPDHHIFFEGFVVSKSGKRWMDVARKFGDSYIWLFLMPPIDVLERRIKIRNGGKDIKLDRLQNTMNCVASIKQKVAEAGMNWYEIDWHMDSRMTFNWIHSLMITEEEFR